MTNGAAKGSQYERDIAKALSLWFSHGEADDWLWRSSQSGGRATQRAKSGKKTENACGDLAAQTDDARLLLDVVTIEIKRGYNKISIADLYEKDSGGFHDFVAQAKKAADLAGSSHWMIIHKRDRRDAVVVTNFNKDQDLSITIMRLSDLLKDQGLAYAIRALGSQRTRRQRLRSDAGNQRPVELRTLWSSDDTGS